MGILLTIVAFLGGLVFIVILGIIGVFLYYNIGLLLAACILRIVFPAILCGGMGMCMFAFLSWGLGGSALVVKIFSFIGGAAGLVSGLYFFGVKEPPKIIDSDRFLC
jgi:hypothetical protein